MCPRGRQRSALYWNRDVSNQGRLVPVHVCCEWKETGNNIDKQPGCKYLEMVKENGQNRVGCHVGWIQFRKKCYWFSQDAKPWVEAKGICALNHTKLAEPRTLSESSFLISYSQRIAGVYWIGISDMIEEGKWIYSSDQTVIQVNDFHPGEPNHHTYANCVVLWQKFDGKWVDEPCGENYRFICETEIE
ncbi:perlucin-like [Ostrea edulis]|uniref:perlucin-like n=1 Tax=Ostrea edulis TaxID=37623 RepID=UPI0024AED7F2|nr:perlucin-like [Ostrea edulis]